MPVALQTQETSGANKGTRARHSEVAALILAVSVDEDTQEQQ
jgi:hypothetical protein